MKATTETKDVVAQLTPSQLGAVARLIARRGRNWKQRIRAFWFDGNWRKHGIETADDASLLQQVRNQLGPAWLNRARCSDFISNVESAYSPSTTT